MQNVINTIIEQLNNEVFVEMDAKVLEASKKWALERQAAVYEFLRTDEAKAMKMEKYKKAFAIAGGKTWYNIFYGNSEESVLAFVEKNCKAIATKRNNSIAKKLEKAGVTEIIDNKGSGITTDGFYGFYTVMTDQGKKRITIESIYAGGYNIQCLHLRVLVKVK